jgi:hypothetical protein
MSDESELLEAAKALLPYHTAMKIALVALMVVSSQANAEIYNYSCKALDGTHPLQVDDSKNVLEWRGMKFNLTEKPDCGRVGWHAENNGGSFDFCTATQGYGAIKRDGEVKAECTLERAEHIAILPNDEEMDRKEQADTLESVKETAVVPYHPDPFLSRKTSPLQVKFDSAKYELMCRKFASVEDELTNSKYARILDQLKPIFPDGRDFSIALGHLERVHSRVYGDGDDYCEKNKAHFSAAAAAVRMVIGCPNLEAIESIVATRIHRGESEAIFEIRKNQCKVFQAGQKASVEETTRYNGYQVARIKPNGNNFDYWVADPDAFKSINPQD